MESTHHVAVIDAHLDVLAVTLELLHSAAETEEQVGEALERFRLASAELDRVNDETSRSKLFAARLQLSPHELSTVWLLVGCALRPDIRSTAKLFAAEPGEDPTLGCIAKIVFGNSPSLLALATLGERGTLRRLGIILRSDGCESSVPESRQTWVLAPRVLRWLLGDDTLCDELRGIVRTDAVASVDTVQALDEEAVLVRRALDSASPPLVVATGAPGVGRRTFLCRFAANPIEIDARRIPADHGPLRKTLRLIVRECLLLDRPPVFTNVDASGGSADANCLELIGHELVGDMPGPVFVTCGPNRPAMRWGRPTIVIDVKPPTSAQRAQLWLRELGQGTQSDGEYLAMQYPLAPALIHHAASAAKARANGQPIQPDDIYQGIRAVLDDKLGDYAKRVEVTQTWDDLVLPADQQEAIDYLIARIRQRRTVYEQWGFAAKVGKGLGTSALFSGPPGTGKTMVAALIAKELGLELYQVDMAKLVSKFIGETERNLAALFDAAEAGHAILLFDEADSLFGKRTDVKSSNDRYANLETNYLLQRLESFTGICLLTSNHESNIDPAFQRRLSLHLRFELPDVEERAALWHAMLPAAAPVAPNLDTDGLARRFVMSGGYIRNAALRAAFLAADEGSVITSAHLERAARLEYEGMGKIAAAFAV